MPRLEMQPCSRGARRSLPLFGPAGGRRAAAQARPAVTGTDTQKLAAGYADGRRDRDEFSRRLDKCLNPGFTPWKFDSQVQDTRPKSPHRARGAIDRRIVTPRTAAAVNVREDRGKAGGGPPEDQWISSSG